jgi:hypothetical protein
MADKGQPSEIPKATFRRGKVVDIDGSGVPSVTIGDDETPVKVLGSDSNYVPQLNDAVDLKVEDTQVTILGMLGKDPSALRGIAIGSAAVATSEARGAITLGALATAGPAVTLTVGPQGLAFASISARISTTSSNDGGAAGVAVSGASTIAAADSLEFYPKVSGAAARIGRVLLFSGLTPGVTTFTCQYRDLFDTGTDVFFNSRVLWVASL